MKTFKFVTISAGLLISSLLPMTASAIPITTTGGADTYLGANNFGSAGFDTWLSNTTGTSDFTEIPGSGGSSWLEVTGEAGGKNLWAFDFGSYEPEHFFVKTGGKVTLASGTTDYDVYAFKNDKLSLNYGVIDLNMFGRSNPGQVTIGIISHVRISAVPEPSIIALFAAGLLGLGLVRRRMRS